MNGWSVRARQATRGWRGIAKWGVGGALLMGVGAWLATAGPAGYEVWLDGRFVTRGSDLVQIETTLRERAYETAMREVSLEVEGMTWRYRMSELGLVMLPEPLTTALEETIREIPAIHRFPWSVPRLALRSARNWDEERLEGALEPIRAAVEREPVAAKLVIEKKIPVITPEEPGRAIARDVVQVALQEMKDDAEHLTVPLSQVIPEVTQNSLAALRIRRLVAEWSTYYDPSIPRAENVERAAHAFDGLMLKPDEILSYNATVGPIDVESGWREAFVIVSGKLVPGIGGGVCQVATTFYGAALRANLEILERHPHQLAISYVAPSQDAAVAQGYQDLKLRNTTAGHLLVETEAGGGKVTFRLYGDVPEGQEVAIESQVTGSTPFAVEAMAAPALPAGEQQVKVKGIPGLRAEAYRLVYEHGRLVRRELLSRDHYLPTTEVLLVGPDAAAGQL